MSSMSGSLFYIFSSLEAILFSISFFFDKMKILDARNIRNNEIS